MKLVSALVLCLVSAQAYALSFMVDSVNISTPTGIYHGHQCEVHRFRLDPADEESTEFLATCGYTTVSDPVSFSYSVVPIPFVRVRLTDISLDRNDCQFIYQHFEFPSMHIGIECGWNSVFQSNFENH